MNRKAYYIEWYDHGAHTTQEWRDEKEYHLKPVLVRSMGFVISETSEYIVLGMTWHHTAEDDDFEEENKFSGDMCIIKNCIKEMRELQWLKQ